MNSSPHKRSSRTKAKGSTQNNNISHFSFSNSADDTDKQRTPRSIIRSPKSLWFLFLGCSFLLLLTWMKISWPSQLLSADANDKETMPLKPTLNGYKLRKAKPKKLHQRSRHERAGLIPANEQEFDHTELKHYFGCDKLFVTPRPVITEEEWRKFRDLYNEFVANEYTSNSKKYPNGAETYKVGKPWHDSPVHGNTTPDKGRGLAASRDISKGDLIFTGTNNTLVFETGPAWRKFLLHLFYAPPPDDVYTEGFACDMVAWSWNQQWPKNGKTVIIVDVDASSLLNKPSRGETNNIQCGKLDGNGECGMDYYASRDIQKGEEILCHYSDFARPKWHSFGL